MDFFVLKTLNGPNSEVHVIDCPYKQMHKFVNMSENEFWTIMIDTFKADFIKLAMPNHHYIMFSEIQQAEKALDWINAQITALKLSGFVPVIPMYSDFEGGDE